MCIECYDFSQKQKRGKSLMDMHQENVKKKAKKEKKEKKKVSPVF